MIYFSFREILLSVGYAALYGVITALIFVSFLSLKGLLSDLRAYSREIISYERVFSSIKAKRSEGEVELSAAATFFAIIFFFLGFILLSYHALDGEIRIYMLIVVFASFYLSKIAFLSVFQKVIIRFFRFVLYVLIVILRLVIMPFRSFYPKIKEKFSVNGAK